MKCRFVEPCSTEEYINAMEDTSGKTWTRNSVESNIMKTASRETGRPVIPVLKLHFCGSAQTLAKTCTKKSKINKFQVIEEVQCTEEKEESDEYYEISEYTQEDFHIENITVLFELTEIHTHLPQYIKDCYNLINIQDARMCKRKPARGKGHTSGESCIKSILMNDVEAEFNLYTGALCTFLGKDYLQIKISQ
ncbi:hypothetical protein O181_055954 [Austropuccinia psidii MF-1]|uniref:Uncharacterized protein n=1 Tax=Austropuccinia psidii MF-1 TaxID=1389203 RepID=A0A9Q3E7K1_9BASI|nr:hypothetical protein [Austropuccinia psidii MF-1]